MLSKNQLVELREAFNMLDTDGDSKLTKEDLSSFLETIGSPFTEAEIEEMIQELQPNPTYIVLLTLIGERLSEISPEKELIAAFGAFDDENDGFADYSLLKSWMVENKDNPIAKEDYDYLVRGCVENGRINYGKLVDKIKHGEFLSD